MKNALKKNVPKIQAMKQEGHDIIDELVRMGWSKNECYLRLSDKLRCLPESAHFRNMFTERDVRRAVTALEAIRAERTHQIGERRRERVEARHRARMAESEEARKRKTQAKIDKAARPNKNILPLAEQKRIMAELKTPNAPKTELREALESVGANLARDVGEEYAVLTIHADGKSEQSVVVGIDWGYEAPPAKRAWTASVRKYAQKCGIRIRTWLKWV